MKTVLLMLFVALYLGFFAAGGYLIERAEQRERKRQRAKEKANRNNTDWQETYKLTYMLVCQKLLNKEK